MESETIESVADARVQNSPVRHQYRILTDEEKALVSELKDKGQALLDLIDKTGFGRESMIAKVKAEEAVMWAVKGVTK